MIWVVYMPQPQDDESDRWFFITAKRKEAMKQANVWAKNNVTKIKYINTLKSKEDKDDYPDHVVVERRDSFYQGA